MHLGDCFIYVLAGKGGTPLYLDAILPVDRTIRKEACYMKFSQKKVNNALINSSSVEL